MTPRLSRRSASGWKTFDEGAHSRSIAMVGRFDADIGDFRRDREIGMAIYVGCDGRDRLMQIASVEQFKRSAFRAFDGAAQHADMMPLRISQST
jgi:hypothetical protein